MFKLRNEKVNPEEYTNTLQEICQQPQIWETAFENYKKSQEDLEQFLQKISESTDKNLRIIFTGAGTSEYVGNVIVDYLKKNKKYQFESIATTDIVSCPHLYLKKDQPTLLVSFARSGNSPESIAAVNLAEQCIDNVFQLAITCAPEGKLSLQLKTQNNAFVLIMPEGSNDKGFAMTSSFTSMLLSALLIFDSLSLAEKEKRVQYLVQQAKTVLSWEEEINRLVDFDFSRIIYLGSGSLYRLTNECRLKVLELTAGKIAAMFESSMGFRHGPKSFINEDTFVIGLVSNQPYTRQYDVDILNEIAQDDIAKKVLACTPTVLKGNFETLLFQVPDELEDVYLGLCYILIAQLISVIASVRVGNTADHPSKSGTVNRVVKGVQIHTL